MGGPATGVTIDHGDGTFTMAGTYTDQYSPNGFGHYYGTYSWPADSEFSTCRDNLGQNCAPDQIGSHCNIPTGQITLQSGYRLITMPISMLFGIHGRPAVCQMPGATTRTYVLSGYRAFPDPNGLPIRGYGDLFQASDTITGTSTPLRPGVYTDNLFFAFILESQPA